MILESDLGTEAELTITFPVSLLHTPNFPTIPLIGLDYQRPGKWGKTGPAGHRIDGVEYLSGWAKLGVFANCSFWRSNLLPIPLHRFLADDRRDPGGSRRPL